MKILAIETSCDETALCLVEVIETPQGADFTILANITHSQIDIHQEYGGVFPALAKREHQKNLPIILEQIMQGQDIPDVICVTSGPGLEPALWTGIVFAQELGKKWNIPVVPVNHMEGHILSSVVPNATKTFSIQPEQFHFPALALLVSGGHTELVLVRDIGKYEIIGKTRDDAVGEAFDKVARILDLSYPGGPEISKQAEQFQGENSIEFPRPMIHSHDFDFSFSGLKTAVLYYVRDNGKQNISEIADAFQKSAIDVLVKKTKRAVDEFGAQMLVIGGGVAANKKLREQLVKEIPLDAELIKFPTQELSTDNAVMIAIAGYFKVQKNPNATYGEIRANGNLSL